MKNKLVGPLGHAFEGGMVSNKQQGAIMIVALVLLFVVTLLAMSGLKTASVQEKMASNAQSSNLAFQHAESAVNTVLWRLQSGDIAHIDGALANEDVGSTEEVLSASGADVLATVRARHLGSFSDEGMSLGKEGEIKSQQFEIVGMASIASTGANTTLTQGVTY